MTDGAAGRPVGDRQGDYVWHGSQWVPHRDSGGSFFDGHRWSRPSAPPLPPLWSGPQFFADPRYAYGLTRQTSDDLQFIARYLKIVIIVILVLAGVGLIFSVFLWQAVMALLQALVR